MNDVIDISPKKTYTAEELVNHAKRLIPESVVNRVVQEKAFRDFLKVLIMYQMSALEIPQMCNFGYALTGLNKKGVPTQVDYLITLSSEDEVKKT